MQAVEIERNKAFVGREYEGAKLNRIAETRTPAIVIVYGRRRVGKTELLEQTYSARNIIKLEGIEGQDQAFQMQSVMQQLSRYANQPLLRDVRVDSWMDVFHHINENTKNDEWTIYFEEVQWLACYKDQFIGELKYAWDNYFRRNKKLIIILCGSSPSFMVNEVVHSKALYSRSQYEIHLKEMNLIEVSNLLKKRSQLEVMDAYLTVGGIPEYILRLNKNSSAMLSLCDQSFTPDSYFSKEYEQIFISSMADNKHYKEIIEFLSKRRFATREEILQHLKVGSGGQITKVFKDLELCEFINYYTPYYLNDDSPTGRYSIQDSYLQFYYHFIKPIANKIERGVFKNKPTDALNSDSYYKWLGYAFERFCRQYSHILAKMLNFAAVNYSSGAYYSRATNRIDRGYQIDLLFDRDDNVITICEIKYLKSPVGRSVIDEFERKLEKFPNSKDKTIHKVLIAASGVNQNVVDEGYFDSIITLDMFFNALYWI